MALFRKGDKVLVFQGEAFLVGKVDKVLSFNPFLDQEYYVKFQNPTYAVLFTENDLELFSRKQIRS